MRRLSLLVVLFAAGCGGGGSSGTNTETLSIEPSSDGYFRRSDSSVQFANSNGISVGSNGLNFVDGFMRFSHPPTLVALAPGNITSVFLQLTKVQAVGNPAVDHSTVELTHPDLGAGAITFSDDAVAVATPSVTNKPDFTNVGVQTWVIDVTAQVKSDLLAGLGRSDFCLYTSGGSATNGFWQFQDTEQGLFPLTTNPGPLLTVTFVP